MKSIDEQMRLEDISDKYRAFVDKFKPKKTTDDCYTPAPIYDAVLQWCRAEYGIPDDAPIHRPFYPGGDYERFEYSEDGYVIDNPPFSIIAKILDYYTEREIKFFLFAPYLTIFSTLSRRQGVAAIVTGSDITYENGARVKTSFFTNLEGDYLFKSSPSLYKALVAAEYENTRKTKKTLPKYSYPESVVTSSKVGKLSKIGAEYGVRKEEAFFVRSLDAQKAKENKEIYGAGYIISKRALARKQEAELEAAKMAEHTAELEACEWRLSERELREQENLA